MINPWDLEVAKGVDTSVSSVRANGGKYTPEQMAALDRGRGELLGEEYNKDDNIDAGLVQETMNLNPTQYAAFEEKTFKKDTSTAVKPWELEQAKPWTLQQEEKPNDFMSFMDPIAKPVYDTIKKGGQALADDPRGFVEGAAHGLAKGVAQGVDYVNEMQPQTWLRNRLQGKSELPTAINARVGQFGEDIDQFAQQNPFSSGAEQRPAGQAAQEVLGLPVKPFEAGSEAIGAKFGPEMGALAMIASMGGLTLLGMRGEGIMAKAKAGEELSSAEKGAVNSAMEKLMADVKKEKARAARPPEQQVLDIDNNISRPLFDENNRYIDNRQPIAGPELAPEATAKGPEFMSRQYDLDLQRTDKHSERTRGDDPAGQGDLFEGQAGNNQPKFAKAEQTAAQLAEARKQAEMEHDYRMKEAQEAAAKAEAEQAQFYHELETQYDRQEAQRAQQGLIDYPFEEQRSSAIADAFSRAKEVAEAGSDTQPKLSGYQARKRELIAKTGGPGVSDAFKRAAGKKQGGAVNFGVADEVARRIKALKEGSQRVERNLDNIQPGQQVRLMNGKTATVVSVADGRYSVKGDGFVDSVPRQGIDYAYKPMGMNSFGKSQRGSVDMNTFLGRKTLDELSKMSDSLMARMRKAKFNSPEWEQVGKEIAALNPVWEAKIAEAKEAKEAKEEQFRQDFRTSAQNIGSGIREVKALARRAQFTDVNKPLGQTKFGKGERGALDPSMIADFFKWFGKSKVVDEAGKPKVLYHGTSKDADFKTFKNQKRGIFLTDDPESASRYAIENDSRDLKYDHFTHKYEEVNTASRVMPVFARLENPYKMTGADFDKYMYQSNYAKWQAEFSDKLRREGYDGIDWGKNEKGYSVYTVFDNSQIKSATALDKPKLGQTKFGKGQSGALDLSAFFGKNKQTVKKGERTAMVFSRMDIPGAEFVKEFMKQKPEGLDQDIHYQMGATTSSFRSTNPLISDPKNPANVVLKFVDDKIHLTREMEHELNAHSLPFFEDFNKHYGIKAMNRFKIDAFKRDVDVAVKMEKDNSTWFNGTDFSPTEAQMVQHGMSPEGAKIWKGMHDVFDDVWTTLSKAAVLAGRRIPDRVPGYIPHVFKGPYRVILRDVSAGGPLADSPMVQEFNYHTKAGAEAAQKAMQAVVNNNPGYRLEFRLPNVVGKGTAELIGGLWNAKTIVQKNKALSALLEAIYESSSKGIVSSVLDRKSITKVGHALERVNLPGALGLTKDGILEAAKQLQLAVEDANGWYARVHFVNDVLHPLDAAGLLDQPKLRKVTETYMESLFRIPNKMVEELDIKVKDQLVRMGMDPGLVQTIPKQLNGGFAKYYLFGKINFYAANAMQKFIAYPYLYSVKALGHAYGETTGSVHSAMKDAYNIFDPKNKQLRKYAEDHGHVDPSFMEAMDPTEVKDPISVGIEKNTRFNSFKVGYHYFKQIMPEAEALKAAGKFSDTVSVPYDNAVGAPTFISKVPSAMRPFVLFYTYNSHMLSLVSQQARIGVQTMKSGNPKAMMYALSGALGLQALNMSLFGLQGAPLVQNWDNSSTLG
jgi:hypothetical protein